MRTKAAILIQAGQPLVLAEVEIPPLKAGQVLVEIAVSSVCHTQILERRGERGVDRYLPHCLGHEGSGIVCDVGQGVRKVNVGDRVVLSWIKGSGANVNGTVYRWGDRLVSAGAITTFSRHAVVSENRLTVIPQKTSLLLASLLGCAVPTGLGAVLHATRPNPGQSMVIFGTGGVGLCAVKGALLSGCAPIIAVDIQKEKLELAKRMGATHAMDGREVDPVAAVKKICPEGADFAIEASGQTLAMRQALASVRPRGGTAVVIGNAPYGEPLELDPWELNLGKRLLGTWGGDNSPDRDFPRYIELLDSGKLDLELLLSKRYSLDQVNEAIDALETGEVVRPFMDMTL